MSIDIIEKPILYLVIPCYNEQEVLPITSDIFINKLNELIKSHKISSDSKILFVNDGSRDNTWNIIISLVETHAVCEGISLSRNYGHQNALLAGLMEAKSVCDCAISLDCDGQDDINAIDKMLDKYKIGNEIVYGVRSSRKTDSFFKRFTAESYYKLLNVLGCEIVYNHADYRLMSKRALMELSKYNEVNLFIRGIVPMIGFKTDIVYYERNERIAGKTHYPLAKMLSLAFNGVTSLSITPMMIIIYIGLIIFLIGLIFLVLFSINYQTISYIIMSLIVVFIGMNSIFLGVLGVYIGKVFLETKNRPRYIIEQKTYVD